MWTSIWVATSVPPTLIVSLMIQALFWTMTKLQNCKVYSVLTASAVLLVEDLRRTAATMGSKIVTKPNLRSLPRVMTVSCKTPMWGVPSVPFEATEEAVLKVSPTLAPTRSLSALVRLLLLPWNVMVRIPTARPALVVVPSVKVVTTLDLLSSATRHLAMLSC